MKKSSNLLAAFLFFISWLLITVGSILWLGILFTSCSTVQKSSQTTNAKTDSAHISTSDEKTKSDSSGTIKKHVLEQYTKNRVIDFDAPVIYYLRGDGSLTTVPPVINDTTTQLIIVHSPKRITTHEEGTREKTTEETAQKTASGEVSKSEITQKKTEQSTSTRIKEKISFSMWWLLLLLIIPVFIYRKRIVDFIQRIPKPWL